MCFVGVVVHPLGALEREEFLSGLAQVFWVAIQTGFMTICLVIG